MSKARYTRAQLERDSRTPLVTPRVFARGVQVTDDAVWVWVQIPSASSFLLEEPDIETATWRTAQAMAGLLPAGAEYHLKVVWARHEPESYVASWDQVHSVRAPGADNYIAVGTERIARNAREGHFRRRVVLLGVRWREADLLPDVGAAGSIGTAGRRAGRVFRAKLREQMWSQRQLHRDARSRLDFVMPAVERWFEQAANCELRATPAPASLIAWSFAREIRRANVTVPSDEALAGPVLVDLAQGSVDPRESPRYVVVTDLKTGERRFVSILVPATNGFPVSELEIPGGEWLEILTEFDGRVEASVRGVNHGQAESIALLDAGRKLTRSQAREASAQGAQVPLEIVDADDTLNMRRREVQRRLDVLTTNHARWVVDAGSPDELEDLIAAVRHRYTGIVQLEVARNLQDLLWRELLPGDKVRVPAFGQDQPMRTLAGSWFHGGSAVGDDTGPYLGANLGSTPGPVQCHIVSRAETDRTRPTSVSFTGMSGAGKSTAVSLAILGALAEGAWSLLVDPKGDLRGILRVAEQLLRVPVQAVDVTDQRCSGIMDPMRFTATADDARGLTLDAMLGALSADDRRRGEVLLEHAIDSVLRDFPQPVWSAQAVIGELMSTPDTQPDHLIARALGRTLSLRAKQAQLRAVLGPLAENSLPLMTGRGLVYLGLAGLDLPRHNPDPDKWTVTERCSITTFRMALSYGLQQSRNVRALKKLVALTELHLITGYPEGKAFVEWLARTGRALQVWLLLDTQAAHDLAQLTGLTEQLVMSFAFRAVSTAEQDAQAALLGRPEPGPRLRQMQRSLSTGQCIMRDRNGRLAPVQFDRLTQWIANALSTDAAEDTADATSTPTAEDAGPVDAAEHQGRRP
ncbi:ATP-binding protein [Labedaea rhizosphaerae]|uniref:AAA domain-containing protein n=1 Tax=Labedaea rhizosphaerae TaxID=598644 RepID=A0A4R6SGF8_LABRH|nr:ATP-binding protein [Labedaea rhizosphaerae]TDQ00600.1 AAA domain-containing protein [Labedaea rhizosphaerae]